MTYKKILFSVIIVGSMMAGCKKFVEKGNVNINPNQPSTVTLNTLLPGVENATAYNYTYTAYITSMFAQQMAAYTSGPLSEDQNIDVRISSAYSGLYTAMTNAKTLIDLGRSGSSPYYRAIGRILFDINLALATDTYGDVPLKEAFQATSILYPAYDSQEDVYNFIQKDLDSAISEIAQTGVAAAVTPGTDDLIFSGNLASWNQTAYFLKAKYYMHTTKKDAKTAATNAIAALANAYTASSSPFQLVYSSKNNNPWYINVSGRISGSAVYTIAPSARFVNALSGVTYTGLKDPRIDTLMQKSGTSTLYTGITNGGGNTSNNTDFTINTFFGRAASPLLMGSYAEQKLMEAEALFLLNGGTVTSVGSTAAAYNAYMAGITSNLSYLGYDTTVTTVNGLKGKAYVDNSQVAVGASGLIMELILRERQVVLFLNPEAWVDVRRYDYNSSLFRGMALPLNQSSLMNGTYIRRALYPTDEINRNPNAKTALKSMTDKVWWDQ